uniref:efflux RND transporter permease subunit n=1 Tax=Pseudomonas sp. K8 TaxID=212200 RepID=UPI0018667E22
ARIQVERAGGKAEIEGAQQTIRTLGTVGDAQALRDYSIALPDGRAVRLSTLANVTDAAADPTEAALLDGKQVVAFSMSRTRGSSEVKVEAGVHTALDQLKASHPGIDFRLVTTAIDETHRSYDSSMTMLWEGALLALLVVWLFLRDWRATWVSALTLAAVFVPVAFMPGIAGKFFREFGWTAATAVLFSLLVARLLTPMMAAYLLKPHGEEKPESKLMTWYLGWVDAALRYRGRTLW